MGLNQRDRTRAAETAVFAKRAARKRATRTIVINAAFIARLCKAALSNVSRQKNGAEGNEQDKQ